MNIGFPEKFLKDVKILDIIEENNNDIESNRFSNIIKEEGIPEHISDKIKDQDITYFHKPENIASGFYTAERRIIPLKDKLTELTNLVTQLQDEVMGTQTDQLTVSIKQGNRENKLTPFSDNYIYPEAYNNIKNTGDIVSGGASVGNYEYDPETGLVTTIFYISLKNDSNHIIKLYSLFPNTTKILNVLKNTKYDINDYSLNSYINSRTKMIWSDDLERYKEEKTMYFVGTGGSTHEVAEPYSHNIGGVWMEYISQDDTNDSHELQKNLIEQMTPAWMWSPSGAETKHTLQTGNQYLYFRTRNIFTKTQLYDFYHQFDATFNISTRNDENTWTIGTIDLFEPAVIRSEPSIIHTNNKLSGGMCINIVDHDPETTTSTSKQYVQNHYSINSQLLERIKSLSRANYFYTKFSI